MYSQNSGKWGLEGFVPGKSFRLRRIKYFSRGVKKIKLSFFSSFTVRKKAGKKEGKTLGYEITVDHFLYFLQNHLFRLPQLPDTA